MRNGGSCFSDVLLVLGLAAGFVACLGPMPALAWQFEVPAPLDQFARVVALDSRGDVFVLSEEGNPSGSSNSIVRLRKLDSFDGHQVWSYQWEMDWSAPIVSPWCWRGAGIRFPDV